ncbi:transcription termination factor MTERF9, chloroplastic [Heracleum sosnowskyi]|uniref:Transcription termination factor MTERF9, chloroplastic n=1 Tax=Heracleum sosnowskyi TaxID=360622 RepID=A0AAD8JLY5_9APIA|nr:transcription termination factor MTERF9, chloroplastic [Heracleum sosnowskyi]
MSTTACLCCCNYNPNNRPQLSPTTSNNIRRRNELKCSVLSSHSNPKLIKSNLRSSFGQPLSPYHSPDHDNHHDDDDDLDEFSEEEEDDEEEDDDDNNNNNNTRLKSRNAAIMNGNNTLQQGRKDSFDAYSKARDTGGSLGFNGQRKQEARNSAKNRYPRLSEELDLDERWIPLLDYLSTYGLKESHFIQMYERHMPSLQINVVSARERLEYLLSVGVKNRDIKKILLRQPQILEYTLDKNLKTHVAFLVSLGIPDSRIGQIISATPSLFSYSVENSLKPTVKYLLEEVGIKKDELRKVVQLSPQILVQRIDTTWNTRFTFLTKELGAPRDNIVKMVRKHPQLLHYSIEDGLLPRINFLRSIGMCNSDIIKVLTSLTQVFSLSLEGNLKPKYMYLVNELQNEVQSLTKYPMYLSLSLDQRIRPRHRFLVALKKAPKGPFPLSSFVPTDEHFCQQWAGTTKYRRASRYNIIRGIVLVFFS